MGQKEQQKPSKKKANVKIDSRTPAGRPHPLTITLTIMALLLTSVGLYWSMAQPDIRYVSKFVPEAMTLLESKVDGSGNLVYSFRARPTFTNHSLKPGFIDKAEFVPLSIATINSDAAGI